MEFPTDGGHIAGLRIRKDHVETAAPLPSPRTIVTISFLPSTATETSDSVAPKRCKLKPSTRARQSTLAAASRTLLSR